MYMYIPLCRYWIALYRYVLVFIVPQVDIELEDNKQFISNIPRMHELPKPISWESKKFFWIKMSSAEIFILLAEH